MLTILHVDDSLDTLKLVRRMIEASGILNPLVSVLDAQHALDLIKERGDEIGIVLVDLVLPGSMNGLDLLREVRRLLPALTLIVITGHDDGDTIEAAKQAGANAYIVKPFEIGGLLVLLLNLARFDFEIKLRHALVGAER